MAENTNAEKKPTRRVPLLVRGIGIFIVITALFAGLYWFCLHHAANVAEWAGSDPADVKTDLVYDGQTYHLAAAVGSRGVSRGKFAMQDKLGEVKPAGRDALTICYQVWSVKNTRNEPQPQYLIVVYGNKQSSDGKSYVYYLDGKENPYKGELPTEPAEYFDDEEWEEDE